MVFGKVMDMGWLVSKKVVHFLICDRFLVVLIKPLRMLKLVQASVYVCVRACVCVCETNRKILISLFPILLLI